MHTEHTLPAAARLDPDEPLPSAPSSRPLSPMPGKIMLTWAPLLARFSAGGVPVPTTSYFLARRDPGLGLTVRGVIPMDDRCHFGGEEPVMA